MNEKKEPEEESQVEEGQKAGNEYRSWKSEGEQEDESRRGIH